MAKSIRNSCSLIVNIVPDDYAILKDNDDEEDDEDSHPKPNRQKKEEKTLEERELEYVKGDDWDRECIEVYDTDNNHVASFTTMSLAWLCLTCFNKPQVLDRIHQELSKDYDLATFPHVCEELAIPEDVIDLKDGSYRLVAVTGASSEDETKTSVSTLFSLCFGSEKIVAKALCSYENSEMNSVGPTIEMFEVAEEWQGHRLGDALMRGVHSFYCAKFEDILTNVLLSVCHVTNFHAARWFMSKHHFKDLDGMCEELGKYLNPDEYEDDDDEE